MKNYSEVLGHCDDGSVVFLTKNGRGKYVVQNLESYEKTQATLQLMNELAKGRRSGETEGWLSTEEVRAHFRARANEE